MFVDIFDDFMAYKIQVNYYFMTNSQFAIFFVWQMTSGKLATLSWQIDTPLSVKLLKNLPEIFWQIGTFQDWG